jgi:hypothetical protein
MNGEDQSLPALPAVPRIRPLIRGARPRPIRAARKTDYLPWLIGSLIVLANVLLAFSEEQDGLLARVMPLMFGIGVAILFELCRRFNLIGCGIVLVLTDLANIFGAGKLLTTGSEFIHLWVNPESFAFGLGNVLLFLSVMVFGALFIDWILNYASRNRPPPRESPGTRSFDRFVLLLMTGVTFAYALVTGAWSAYGSVIDESAGTRAYQWEMFYDPLVANCVVVLIDDVLRTYERKTSPMRRVIMLSLLLLLALLVFARQYRRQMACLLVTGVLMVLSSETVIDRLQRSARRMVLLTGALAVVAVVLNFGSLAWRRSSNSFHTNNPMERLVDAAGRVGEIDDSDLDGTRKRFTYLTVDAAAYEFRPLIADVLQLDDLFIRSLAFAMPRVIFPGKIRYLPPTCENAFYSIVPEDYDLACTTSSEGYLAGGTWGIVAVGLTFALIGAVASIMIRRRSVLSLVAGFQLVYPMTSLEGSAFAPLAYALRALALIPLALIGVRWAFQLVIGWNNWTQKQTVRRQRPALGR